MAEATLIIYSSPNGRDDWTPVRPQDAPEWVKDPRNIAKMIDGEMCMKCDEGEAGSNWYRAERVLPDDEAAAVQAAEAKRARKRARNLATVH